MGDWEVEDKSHDFLDLIMTAASGGYLTPGEYTVRNTETGEERTVYADNETELGEKIANGQFNDK